MDDENKAESVLAKQQAIARRDAVRAMLGTAFGGVALMACTQPTEGSEPEASDYEPDDVSGLAAGLQSTSYLAFDKVTGATGPNLKDNDPGPSATGLITAIVLGYWAKDDGGGGTFVWDPSSSAVDNGGTVIQPTSSATSGRWLRVYSGPLNVKWFGAKGNGTTGDGARINAAIAECGAKGGGTVYIPASTSTYNITDQTVVVNQEDVCLTGDGMASCLYYNPSTAGADKYALIFGSQTMPNIKDLRLANFQIQTGVNATGAIKVSGATRWRIELMYLFGIAQHGTGITVTDFSWIGTISGGQFGNFDVGIRFRKATPTSGNQAFNSNEVTGELELIGCNYGIIVGDEAADETTVLPGSGLMIENICVEGNFHGGIWVASGDVVVIQGVYFENNDDFHIRIGSADNDGLNPRGGAIRDCRMIIGGDVAFIDVVRSYGLVIESNWLDSLGRIGIKLAAGSDGTRIYDNFIHGGSTEDIAGAGSNTWYRNRGTTRRIDTEAETVIEGARVKANGALNATPRIRFRAHYDADPTGTYTDATMEAEMSVIPSAGGASPAGRLQLYLVGGGSLYLHRVPTDNQGYVQVSSRLAKSVYPDPMYGWSVTVTAGFTVPSGRQICKAVGTGAITLTSTPTILFGVVDMQELEVLNATQPGSGFTLTLQDQSILPGTYPTDPLGGSRLRLKSGTTTTLAPCRSARFLWNAQYNEWWEQ